MAGQNTALTPAEMRSSVDKVKRFFSASNPNNHTGKPINDWISGDLKKVASEDLYLLSRQIADEQYSITDDLLPKGMSREDFNRNILREMRRRNVLKNDYLDGLLADPGSRNKEVKLMRVAYGTGSSVPVEVRESASVMAIRDAALDIILNDPSTSAPDAKGRYAYPIKSDLAAAIGIPTSKLSKMALTSDVDAYDFGYLVGSIPQFVDGGRNNGLTIMPSVSIPQDELQARYCPVIRKLFQTGQAFPNRDAFMAGLLQGRVDLTANFEPRNEHVGLTAACS